MSLDHPAFLWLLLLLPLDLAISLRRLGPLAASFRGLAPPADRDRIAGARRRWAIPAMAASGIFIIAASLALAGPSWGGRVERVERSGLEIALVLDVSRSMEARDAPVSRLAAAKSLARFLISGGLGDAFSLVVAKGEGLLLVPMTEDFDAVDTALDYADPSVMSRAGTDLGSGIEAALASFSPIASSGRVIVLLSDGGDQGRSALSMAVEARAKAVRILSVGFGGPEPTSIPGPDGKALVGTDGQPVRVALEDGILRALASGSKGRYFDSAQGSSLSAIREELVNEGRVGTRNLLRFRSRAALFAEFALFAVLLRFAALLFSTWFRRGDPAGPGTDSSPGSKP
ncbi:MAG: VWA domain-containing protein [Spirochaetota bacterium]